MGGPCPSWANSGLNLVVVCGHNPMLLMMSGGVSDHDRWEPAAGFAALTACNWAAPACLRPVITPLLS